MITLALAHLAYWFPPVVVNGDYDPGAIAIRRTDAEILSRVRASAGYWASREDYGFYGSCVRDFLTLRDMFRGVPPRDRGGISPESSIRCMPWRGETV